MRSQVRSQGQVQEGNYDDICPITLDHKDVVGERDGYYHRWTGTAGDAQYQFYNVCALRQYISTFRVGTPKVSPTKMPMTARDIQEVKDQVDLPGVCPKLSRKMLANAQVNAQAVDQANAQHRQAQRLANISVPIEVVRRSDGTTLVICSIQSARRSPVIWKWAFWMRGGLPYCDKEYDHQGPEVPVQVANMSRVDARSLYDWTIIFIAFRFLPARFPHALQMNDYLHQLEHIRGLQDDGVPHTSFLTQDAIATYNTLTMKLENLGQGVLEVTQEVGTAVDHAHTFIMKPLVSFVQQMQVNGWVNGQNGGWGSYR